MSQILVNQDALLRISHLSVTFTKDHGTFRRWKSTVEAVKDISLEIHESEIVAVVGESGCGKTTLARSVVKFVEPTGGSILYQGIDVSSFKINSLMRYRRDVQMVFQDPYESLNPRQDVFRAISNPIRYLLGEKDRSRIQEMVENLMKEVGLDPARFSHRLPHQLSGGERQRVSIARALATDPKLLIADEPTTMLDAAQRFGILHLLSELRSKRKLAVLLITHDLATAKALASRMYVMYLGQLVEMGSTRELISRPHHPYLELILQSSPSLDKSLEKEDPRMRDHASTLEDSWNVQAGCIFRPRCKYATAICSESRPELREKSDLHYAACHNPL
jgi:peptide/nickel transport system ATP-binding protein